MSRNLSGMTNYLQKKTYFYYTTCPKCAKAYGKNYVVSLVEV
ncbi:MAG: hydrolase [Bacteroidales bacterium]